MWRSLVGIEARCARVLVLIALGACGDDGGVTNLPDAPSFPDAPPDAPVDAVAICPPLTGAGTLHGGSVTSAETWTAATSPHDLPFDMTISAAVTIEACAVVRIGNDKTLTVVANGSIVASGTPGLPVTIERLDPANSWASIRAIGGTLTFRHAVIRGGGDPLNATLPLAAALDVRGGNGATLPILTVENLTIEGSESQGILLHQGGGFVAGSTGLTITGAAGFPMHSWARAAGTIPSGAYTGNAIDEILLDGSAGAIRESSTLLARGVPYRVGTQPDAVLDVSRIGGVASLTIEPGVTLRFGVNGRLRIDPAGGTAPANGALIAIGTPAAPIVFTSAAAAPQAGDWNGIWLGNVADPTTRIQHARVEFAGGPSVTGSESCVDAAQTGPNDAAIRILGGDPATQFVTDTAIVSSARHGIDRGFRSNTKPDFLPSNTFTSVVGCSQTHPRDVSGVCPAIIPCP